MSKTIIERLVELGIKVKTKAQDDGSSKYANMKLAGYVGVASDPRQTNSVREAAMLNVQLWLKEVMRRETPVDTTSEQL